MLLVIYKQARTKLKNATVSYAFTCAHVFMNSLVFIRIMKQSREKFWNASMHQKIF